MGHWTTADADMLRAAIRAAIANGSWQVQVLTFENESITLRSLEDARELLKEMEAQASAAAGGLTKYVVTSKGV